jgi:hypothetical protein
MLAPATGVKFLQTYTHELLFGKQAHTSEELVSETKIWYFLTLDALKNPTSPKSVSASDMKWFSTLFPVFSLNVDEVEPLAVTPGAHTSESVTAEMKLFLKAVNFKNARDWEDLFLTSCYFSFWSGALFFGKHMLKFNEASLPSVQLYCKILASLGDETLLLKYVPSMDTWCAFFQVLLSGDFRISFQQALRACASTMGIDTTVSVLLSTPAIQSTNMQSTSGLDILSFVSDCLTATEQLEDQARVGYGILEAVDSHLWSTRSNMMHPTLSWLLEAELNPEDENNKAKLATTATRLLPLRPLLEGHHNYGIHVDGGDTHCHVCTLPLDANSEQGHVLAFTCGHAYHEKCVSQRACERCFNRDFRLVLE